MGRPRKSPSISDGNREIITRLIEEYDIKTVRDIQNTLRDLLGDTIHRMCEVIRKQTAYVKLGISEEGHKEVLSITVGENESAKFWLSM